MTTLDVKPIKRDGMVVIVRQPEKQNRVMPEAGDTVPDNSYWRRRLRDRDIELNEKASKSTAKRGTK